MIAPHDLAGCKLAVADPLLHQRVARRGQFEEGLRVAAGVGMRSLCCALERLVDFRCIEVAVERQAKQLPAMLFHRQRLRRGVALAESRSADGMERLPDHAEPPPCGTARHIVGRPERGIAQGRQPLRGGTAQRVVVGSTRDVECKSRGLMPIDRRSRPQTIDPELPFLQLRSHGHANSNSGNA